MPTGARRPTSKAHWKNELLRRGFLLGQLYEQGGEITAARIRRELRVSKATAKRHMKTIGALVGWQWARQARVVRKVAA